MTWQLNREFFEKKIQIAGKHFKMCSTALAIRKMGINTA